MASQFVFEYSGRFIWRNAGIRTVISPHAVTERHLEVDHLLDGHSDTTGKDVIVWITDH